MIRLRKVLSISLTTFLCLQLAACGSETASDAAGNSGSAESGLEETEEIIEEIPIPDNALKWDYFANIDTSSFKTNSDGSVYFESEGPDGEKIRFWGEDLDVTNSSVILHQCGRLVSLDSIGRIYDVDINVSDPGDEANWLSVYGGYSTNGDAHPGDLENMAFTCTMSRRADEYVPDLLRNTNVGLQDYQPNFIGIGVTTPTNIAEYYMNSDDVEIGTFEVTYTPDKECTGFKYLVFDDEFYGYHFIGEPYEKDIEGRYSLTECYYDFALYGIPDLAGSSKERSADYYKSLDLNVCAAHICESERCYTVGDLLDKDGNVLDKDTACYEEGMSLIVNLGSKSYPVSIPVFGMFEGAANMHDLVPYAFPEASGDLNVLVIPIAWQDQPENANESNLNYIKGKLGRVAGIGGSPADTASVSGSYSLSEYFDISSYGKLHVNSYITDWYKAPHSFQEYEDWNIDLEFETEVMDWFYKNYSGTDMSMFDRDSNGYVDAAILINVGETYHEGYYETISFGGAICNRETYGYEYAGTPDKPMLNSFVNINNSFLKDNANTLIHEFSHGLGLIDYYDVTYSGINAVGGYDMQSENVGDWNVYSKYSVGWISPEIVKGLDHGASTQITIRSFADYGDAIIIPAAGSDVDPPFGEYMAVELFTGTGTDTYDCKKYDLNGLTGVRIYHVDARMESHDYVPMYMEDFDPVTVGTVHVANDYSEKGLYNLELIQAGGVNTFTDLDNLDPVIDRDDFFKAGDAFTMNKYSSFFRDGRFDEGSVFDYRIEVVSITGSGKDAEAVIRVTRE